ncbi:MAG: hypothetical protein ACK5PB_09240 [Pirellula sp.]|jgi:hypothetical protein
MSNATLRAPAFVQTHFQWDDEAILSTLTETQSKSSQQASNPHGSAVNPRTAVSRNANSQKNRSSGVAPSTNRLGGCVHVGSPLVKVLGKYGFSLDDLLIEIERQKNAAS